MTLSQYRENVLITQAKGRIAYVAICSLAKKGIPVYAADYFFSSMGFFSRYVTGRDVYTNPYSDPEQFISDLLKIIEKRKIRILMPMYDETFIIAKYAERFPPEIILPFPNYNSIMALHHKPSLYGLAEQESVPYPSTFFFDNLSEIASVINELSFPVMLKPERGGGGWGIITVNSPEEVQRAVEGFDKELHKNRLMLQEIITGSVYGQALLCKDGNPLAGVTYRVVRQFPPETGTPSCRENVVRNDIEEYSLRILKSLKWTGVCQLDYIISDKTDRAFLIDANPRFWGSIAQGIASGVDFPFLLYKLCMGEKPNNIIRPLSENVKSAWLWGDLAHIFSGLVKKRLSPQEALLSFKSLTDCYFDDFRLADPLPFFAYPLQKIEKLVRKMPASGV